MKVVMYVMAKPKQSSLRELIANDIKHGNGEDGLAVISMKTADRPNGWAKINKPGSHGTLNLEWDAAAKTLIVRAVTRAGNKPNEFIGTFVNYLLRVHGKRISTLTLRTLP